MVLFDGSCATKKKQFMTIKYLNNIDWSKRFLDGRPFVSYLAGPKQTNNSTEWKYLLQ